MSYGLSLTLDRPFDDVVTDVRAALAGQGFGVVSEIDMQATLKSKIGVDIEPQLILGACNPGYAHRSLQVEPSIGLLLPCNVVVRSTDAGTVVEMINPQMQELADEVSSKLAAALETLRPSG